MGIRERLRVFSLGSRSRAVVALALSVLSAPAFAGDGDSPKQVTAAQEQFFEQKVRPLLVKNCYGCHGDQKQKGGLRLDSLEAILKGGDSGPAVVPGKPGESLVVEAVNHDGLEMPPPPAVKLTSDEVAVLARWISLGAPWPSRASSAHAVATSIRPARSRLTAEDREFWAFRPIAAVPVPAAVRSTGTDQLGWSRNPIDRFIEKTLRDHDLTPAPEADRSTLIRRVTFDLTGLPPTPAELDAFLADDSPDAYENLVDRLLDSPRYGQRMGRHWLDLVRFADSDGYRQDAFRPHAWLYRDYVVRAFNRDKPYDRFLTEQLAGDELDPDDPELRVATGYLRLGPYEFNQRDVRKQWADILNDITDVTGEVFLGLGIGCARCHDHKFDPILQRDYYRLQAFFTPLLPRDDLTLARSRGWTEYLAKRAGWDRAVADLLRQIAALEKPYRDKGAALALAKFPDDIQAILQKPPADRSPLEQQLGVLAYRQVQFEHDQVPSLLKGRDKTRWQELQEQLKRCAALRPVAPEPVLAVTDVGPVSPPTAVPGTRGEEPTDPGFLSVLDPRPAHIEKSAAAPQSTGRRLSLARWLTGPDNPLSARVVVNRVWQYHFGKGLVGTASDFGRLGETPSHPELLDWLARDFVVHRWHFKPLHRLIVTSSAYRQSTRRNPEELARASRVDPENRLLWTRRSQRLDAEEIRDAMLAVSGELEPVMGGPSVLAKEPRRTIDTRLMRNSHDALLDAFDAPDGYASTPARDTTTTATQALLLINSDWSLARARAFAGRLERSEPVSSDHRSRVARAYSLAYGRQVHPDELARALGFMGASAERAQAAAGDQAADHAALVDFCHVLLNSNEFLYVD
jgi:hypothetical protein